MSTVIGKSQFTPEDLLRFPGDDRFELVQGRLVSTEMSGLAALLACRIAKLLCEIIDAQRLGVVFTSDASYQCFPDDPDKIRRPDVSFIQRSRMRPEFLRGHIPVAPDLVVEVVSPTDLFVEVRRKAGEYVAAGVRLVWVVNPDEREIQIFRGNGAYQLVKDGDSLVGEDVVPGFLCPLADIFQLPPMGA